MVENGSFDHHHNRLTADSNLVYYLYRLYIIYVLTSHWFLFCSLGVSQLIANMQVNLPIPQNGTIYKVKTK